MTTVLRLRIVRYETGEMPVTYLVCSSVNFGRWIADSYHLKESQAIAAMYEAADALNLGPDVEIVMIEGLGTIQDGSGVPRSEMQSCKK